MIERLGAGVVDYTRFMPKQATPLSPKSSVATMPSFTKDYTATSLVNAYQAYHGINNAKTVSFGNTLLKTIDMLKEVLVTCKDPENNKGGEEVGSRINVSDIIRKTYKDLPNDEDALKTNIEVNSESVKLITDARTQIKNTRGDYYMYEMTVRQPRLDSEPPGRTETIKQKVQISQMPKNPEKAYILNTKGKLTSVIEDKNNVILTNFGDISIRDDIASKSKLKVHAEIPGRSIKPFTTSVQTVIKKQPMPSIGEGTEIVIGMEKGRFVPEIIDSIETFINKVNSGEIVLDQFVAAENVKDAQLTMLSGGFGSRAEYTNASSDGIFHSKDDGATSTKGVFRTATGLTPMETTFISLHKAGLLDCSKGKLKIGGNIKLYLNESGVNKGNGGFTVDLYDKMERDGRKFLSIFPNDSMSRMPIATREMFEKMQSGRAAIAMISKRVPSCEAKGTYGIMKLNKDNEILEFAEKPKVIPDGYEDNHKMCLTNTFQFSVSKEAFKALSILDSVFKEAKGKEPRDWSKTYVPAIMALTQRKPNGKEKNISALTNEIAKIYSTKIKDKDKESFEAAVQQAKSVLGNQKVYSIPTDEPWADVGNMDSLYKTTMLIAKNEFPLEDFERSRVLECVNTQTGLIASSKEQKEVIEAKYKINGEVMAVPRAKKVDQNLPKKYANIITINPKK